MRIVTLLGLALCSGVVTSGYAQLSKDEGEVVELPGNGFSCFLPKYFKVKDNPPGIIHEASGTFIVIVKVPDNHKFDMNEGIQRSFFEEPRCTILSLQEEDARKVHREHGRLYFMKYTLGGNQFERHTLLISHNHDQYLVIGNYLSMMKDQVLEEVEKAMGSFMIH